MLDPTQVSPSAPPASMPAPPLVSPVSAGTAPPPPKPNLNNRFVQRALLYNETTDSQAQRLAAATSQPPANSTDLSSKSDELAKAWNFSPSQDPATEFWQLHDQTLAKNLAQIPPGSPPEAFHGAHNDAETQALNQVFPYRAELMGVGTKQLEDQVAQAARIKRMVEGQTADTSPAPAPVQEVPVAAPPPPMPMPPVAPPPLAPPPLAAAPMPAPPPAAQAGPPMLTPTGGPV